VYRCYVREHVPFSGNPYRIFSNKYCGAAPTSILHGTKAKTENKKHKDMRAMAKSNRKMPYRQPSLSLHMPTCMPCVPFLRPYSLLAYINFIYPELYIALRMHVRETIFLDERLRCRVRWGNHLACQAQPNPLRVLKCSAHQRYARSVLAVQSRSKKGIT
jgi:hypothetical protein